VADESAWDVMPKEAALECIGVGKGACFILRLPV
jgi:hypothetical protein